MPVTGNGKKWLEMLFHKWDSDKKMIYFLVVKKHEKYFKSYTNAFLPFLFKILRSFSSKCVKYGVNKSG
jgi:hypothetical protein